MEQLLSGINKTFSSGINDERFDYFLSKYYIADFNMELVKGIDKYLLPVYINVGLMTNLLSGVVYVQVLRWMGRVAGYVPLLIGASIFSGIYMFTLLLSWLQVLGVDFITPAYCHYVTLFHSCSVFLHTWYMMALSIYHYCLFNQPYVAKYFLTVTYSGYICIAFVILAVIVFTNIVYMQTMIEVVGYKDCAYLPAFYNIGLILQKCNFILNNAIPCISILLLNSLVLRKLLTKKTIGFQLVIASQNLALLHNVMVKQHQRKVKRTVIFISILTSLYILCALPPLIANYFLLWEPSKVTTTQAFLALVICLHIPDVFQSLTIILYITLDGNFYKQFKKTFNLTEIVFLTNN